MFILGTGTGAKDYSNHVIAGTYEVNNEPQYTTWDDAGRIEHRFKQRDKVVGSFDMFFRTASDYATFKSDLDANRSTTNDSVNMTVKVNDLNQDKTINAFISFKLVRNRDGKWNDYFERFKVTIRER